MSDKLDSFALAKLICHNHIEHKEIDCPTLKLIWQLERQNTRDLFKRLHLCIECGMQDWTTLIETDYGGVCIACYNSGDTGEPYYVIFGK